MSVILYVAILGISLILIRKLLKSLRGQVDRQNEISISGKTVLITGASAGIGRATAFQMAERGANVIMACRNLSKAREAVSFIRRKTTRGQLTVMELDLESLESVRKFAEAFNQKYDTLDVLILNAGVMLGPANPRRRTKDGFELHFGVNHLGHFLLANLLIKPLKNAAPSRVVILSSMGHSWGSLDLDDLMAEKPGAVLNDKYGSISGLYSNSKLANALFNKELSKRLSGTGVRTYALCPGIVFTDLGRHLQVPFVVKLLRPLFWYFLRSSDEGAATVVYCALSKTVAHQSGEMYRDCSFWDPSDRIELKDEDAERLWKESQKLVNLKTTI